MLLDALERHSSMEKEELKWISRTASRRYKVYSINKRNGGVRIIEHPSKDIKLIQRWINSFLFKSLPCHESATAYKRGGNIRKNAELHVNSNFTLRMDFKEFFPSFSYQNIQMFLMNINDSTSVKLTEEDIDFVCLIVCRNGALTIGAPSSPILTNVMMFEFDVALNKFARDSGLVYSRYADDMFLSSFNSGSLKKVEEYIKELSKNFKYANLVINEDKTTYLSRKYKRSIAGIVITTDRRISIGRERKRIIKSMIYKFRENTLEDDKVDFLRGMVAFSMDADPEFFISLMNKYGDSLLNQILRRSS